MSEAKKTKRGFTLVELLTVLAIITLLVGLLVPSLTMVRRTAKEAKQKAMLASMEAALTAFRNDYGDYPPSDGWDPLIPPAGDTAPYGGAQKLAEALLGRDLMGFHPATGWRLDDGMYPVPGSIPADEMDLNLRQRKDRYLELATVNAFYLAATGDHDGLYNIPATSPLWPGRDTFVLCDVFGKRKVTMGDGKVAKAGAPILYYKANTSSKLLKDGPDLDLRIYAAYDNVGVIISEDFEVDGALGQQPLAVAGNWENFYNYIQDPTVPYWPYRPDSYLLITAGYDGIYGTADDIRNFGN